jgi:alkane 1-monooxygenase
MALHYEMAGKQMNLLSSIKKAVKNQYHRMYALEHIMYWIFILKIIKYGDISILEGVGITLTTGLLGGAAFNVSHELLHRRGLIDRILAKILLIGMLYPGFYYEHKRWHHKWVATKYDPSSAPLGSSIYKRVPFAIFFNIKKSFKKDSSQGNRSDLNIDIILLWVAALLMHVTLFMYIGIEATAVMGVGALISIVWLEIANYFQHYGLTRRAQDDGSFERTSTCHSWDVNQPVMNMVWAGLPMHAQHHVSPTKSVFDLNISDGSYKYPFGYLACTFLALWPKKWESIAMRLIDEQSNKSRN